MHFPNKIQKISHNSHLIEEDNEFNKNLKRQRKSIVETQKSRMNGKNIAQIID